MGALFRHWRLAAFVLVVLIAVMLAELTPLKAFLTPGGIEHLRGHIRELGWLGAALYLLIYVCFVTVGLPNLPFQIAAGVIYGPLHGFLLMYLGTNLGALGAFFFARLLGRHGVETIFGTRARALNRVVAKGGFKLLATMRLIPLMPFNAINFACGLSRMPLGTYLIATAAGSIPLTFAHVFFGSWIRAHFWV